MALSKMDVTKLDFENLLSSPPPLLSTIQPSTTADLVALITILLTALGYLTSGTLWLKPNPLNRLYFERPQEQDGKRLSTTRASRDIAQALEENDNRLAILWGSQSGTAERLAEELARECTQRFGLNAVAMDLSDIDAETIASISESRIAVFMLSTYGEGDPSDNASGLWNWTKKLAAGGVDLSQLRYVAFGLGNSNYKYYNRVVDVVVEGLDHSGAKALMPVGRADDAEGGTTEDFYSWKEELFGLFRRELGFEEKAVEYRPALDIRFEDAAEGVKVYDGTPMNSSVTGSPIGALAVKNTRELFTAGDRNCVHLELDISEHPDIHYKTGDHVAVWPSNPEEEVERLIGVLGLQERKDAVLTATSLHGSTKIKIASPTTPRTLFRTSLEICAPVSRKAVLDLAQFAPSAKAKSYILELGQDKQRYADFIACTHLTFARLLQLASPSQAWTEIPLSFIIEVLPSLQPRYYSICSSSVLSPRKVAITALVSNKITWAGTTSQTIHGLASNYLLAISKLPPSDQSAQSAAVAPTYDLAGPANVLNGTKLFAHIRKSKFKLPITSSTHIVMVAAGTGLAPFRAFVAERAKLHSIGKPVGKMLLFFGCRHPDSDYIYREELEKMQEELGDKLEIVTAFSRVEGEEKVHVQQRVGQYAEKILALMDASANLYMCGKASMAREADKVLEESRKEAKGWSDEETKAWTDQLKKRGKWRSEVWG